MPAYCYRQLTDTVIIPTGIIIMHAHNSILNVDNDIMLDGSSNFHVVKAFMLYQNFIWLNESELK